MATQALREKDLYAVLDVPHDASTDTVRRAYRKLARRHHPDTNAGSTVAEKRFQKIGEAFAVLSDPDQRREYDGLNARIHRHSRPTPSRSTAPNGSGGSSRADEGFEDYVGAWSMAWAPLWRPTVWWGQAWWAPLLSTSWSTTSWSATSSRA
jgi:molecular chaperone DnaJ